LAFSSPAKDINMNATNTTHTVTRQTVGDPQRISHTAGIFGINFPMHIEPFVYSVTGCMAKEYRGGYWEFYSLSNGGFYMAPKSDVTFQIVCENGYEGVLSADALGITACLYAYSHLSFSEGGFAEACAQQYHWLREYMLEHPDAGAILGAID
jgi:hypothetical protein